MDPRFDPSCGPAADLAAMGSVAAGSVAVGLDAGERPAVRQRLLKRQRFLPATRRRQTRSWAGGFDFSPWSKPHRGGLHLVKPADLSKL
jgi:hypothetical protein